MIHFSLHAGGNAYHFSTTWLTPGRILRVWCKDVLVLVILNDQWQVVGGEMVGWN